MGILLERAAFWSMLRTASHVGSKQRPKTLSDPTMQAERTSCSAHDGNLSEASPPYRSSISIISTFPQLWLFTICLLLVSVIPCSAVLVNYQNCLSQNIQRPSNNNPLPLQFVPLHVYASFNTTSTNYNLNVTVYGNVSGIATQQAYPAPDDPQWINPNKTVGKIVDLDPSSNKYSTLLTKFNVLSYTPYSDRIGFCNSTLHGRCPLGPSFRVNSSDLSQLSAFSVAHNLFSSYAFTTISTNLRVISGAASAAELACISASITPDLGKELGNVLTYLPLVVLILVGIATACAAIYSPWGSNDIFHWSSNYGRDPDLLRLVTPGFGDCLQYIQFVVLAGSLSLNYPGFFQPVVSHASWSTLMFNESFVSGGNGTQSLVDGIYSTNGSYGLDTMSQLVGMTAEKDIWAGMVIWLLVILAAVTVLIQIGFFSRWIYRQLSNTPEEDLREKNVPFTVGNAVRIVFNYFLLPIVALSMYQLVIAGRSPAYTIALAVLLLVAMIGFAGWLLWLIAGTRPRSYLFDDLPTVLLYGPLYNTYSDNAAAFALIPVMLTFLRGVAIGAVQPSGIAQLILLAICEVILILTLNAFRPFHSPTSMNFFHTCFAAARLLTILLSVAFVPSLSVADSPRGWIGYIILLLHGIVLVFGFFLNACQTLIEVGARLAGAGGEEGTGGGAARGGFVKVFGMRQLSRRNPRRTGRARGSIASDAAILDHDGERKSVQLNGGRSRSMSASSAILLNRQGTSARASIGLDSISVPGGTLHKVDSSSAPYTPTSGAASAFSYQPSTSQTGGHSASPHPGLTNSKAAETADPYYRPPRPRRTTIGAYSPGGRSRTSWASGDWANKRWSQHTPDDGSPGPIDGPSASGRATPMPAHLGTPRDRSNSVGDDPRRSKTDYAIREVDFYYGVRGPALSTLPTRRLKTGPADPTGPVSSAAGWIKNLFGGKTKDKGKGFEVVRSSRAPPPGPRTSLAAVNDASRVPYQDDPDSPPIGSSRDLDLDDGVVAATPGMAITTGASTRSQEEDVADLLAANNEEELEYQSEDDFPFTQRESQISQLPPSLPAIETSGSIEFPSGITSNASSRPLQGSTGHAMGRPTLPRKSSRRTPSQGKIEYDGDEELQLSVLAASPPNGPVRGSRLYDPDHPPHQAPQPGAASIRRLPFDMKTVPSSTNRLSISAESAKSSDLVAESNESSDLGIGHPRHSSSVLGSYAPDVRHDRPSSLGYVQQHRASDNIHKASPDDPPYIGSSAEVVNFPFHRSVSPEMRLPRR